MRPFTRAASNRYTCVADRVRLLGAAASLPDTVRSSAEVESLIAASSPGYRVRPGSVRAISGVETRRVASDHTQCSDLAADAAVKALEAAGVAAADVGVLIFAAASQDLAEPATANIVQEKTGTSCQVFDIKNACNSFLNGLQMAESLILGGSCDIAVVATGEICSRGIAWNVRDHEEFRRNFPGYTMGDAGAAAVVGRSDNGRGIFYRRFVTTSRHWELATIRGGGSMHPRGDQFTFLDVDGAGLKQAFVDIAPAVVERMQREAGVAFADFDRILVHQATVPYLAEMLEITGIPADRVELTVSEFGNMASASMPVAYARAVAAGRIVPGERVLWFGLASGISVGVMMMHA